MAGGMSAVLLKAKRVRLHLSSYNSTGLEQKSLRLVTDSHLLVDIPLCLMTTVKSTVRLRGRSSAAIGPMADKDWKREERIVAKILGGRRTGPLGSNYPDVSGTPGVSVECKLLPHFRLTKKDLEQARNNARPGTSWVLTMKKRKSKERLAVMDFNFFAELYTKYRQDHAES